MTCDDASVKDDSALKTAIVNKMLRHDRKVGAGMKAVSKILSLRTIPQAVTCALL